MLRNCSRYSRALPLCFLALTLACASAGTSTTDGTNEPVALRNPAPQDVIVAADLTTSTAITLHEAIQQLRPEMLTGKGRGAPEVYIEKVLQPEGVDRLKQLTPRQVSRVVYLRPVQAAQVFGSQAPGGALAVTLQGQ